MGTVQPLATDVLYRHCDLSRLPFHTTAELTETSEIIGQSRAVDGRLLEAKAAQGKVPTDNR